jgi:hypothetical protein
MLFLCPCSSHVYMCSLVFLCTPLHVFWAPRLLLPFCSFLFARVGARWLQQECHYSKNFKLEPQVSISAPCLCFFCVHVLILSMCLVFLCLPFMCFLGHKVMFPFFVCKGGNATTIVTITIIDLTTIISNLHQQQL